MSYDIEIRIGDAWSVTVGRFHGETWTVRDHVYLAQDRGHTDSRIESVRIPMKDLPAVIAALQTKLSIVDALATLA